MSNLKHSDVLELMAYDPEVGIFTWKKQRRGVITGKPLGCCNGNGYLRITVLGQVVYAHRLAWFYVYGKWPQNQIDHINGSKNDNRIANLRDVTNAQNAQNKPFARGVSWHKKSNKWQAHFCFHKTNRYLGLFDKYEDAATAYIAAKEKSNVCL